MKFVTIGARAGTQRYEMAKFLKTSSIHSLRKDHLLAIAEEFNLDPEGTVEDIRRRFLALVAAGQHTEELQQRLLELETIHTCAPSPTKAQADV